jgi:NAD(P)-dependent dehydrogenase (short-subunit alcohol dehydrogenase family)
LRSVLWVSSIFSKVGGKAHAAYAACKAAANAYVRCAALELAPHVRVNSLVLGSVDTPMAANALADPEIAESIAATIPLGLGKPEQVADAIAFLISQQNTWITGQEIVMDGGRSINFSHK